MGAPANPPRSGAQPSKALQTSLWLVQVLMCITFAGTGLWKLLTPLSTLASTIPWAGQVPEAFLQLTAVFDLLGGIGILLPSITRIKPALAWLAALGCALLQVGAIIFHLSRGEAANTPFNVLLVVLSLFVAWGRRSGAPVEARS